MPSIKTNPLKIGLSPPNVSVILPTYNRGAYIGQAISSVLTQTFPDFELIIVDDGSSDETQEIVSTFEDVRVRYVHQPNRGRSNARNHALELATGRYIAFLDSDDMYLPGKLELQVNYLDSLPCIGMIYTSAQCINERSDYLPEKFEAGISGHIYEDIAFFRPVTIALPTVMVRRDVFNTVGRFDEQMHRFEDTDMWRRISKFYRIDAIQEYTCLIRTHKDNELKSQNPNHIAMALNYYTEKIIKEDKEIRIRIRKKGLAQLYLYYAAAFSTVPEWHVYRDALLFKSFQYWPWSFIKNCAFYTVRESLRYGVHLPRIIYYRSLNAFYKLYLPVKPYMPSYIKNFLRRIFDQ